MDTQTGQSRLHSDKKKLLLGIGAGLVVAIVIGMTGNLSSLSGSVSKKQPKNVDMTVTWVVPTSVLSTENIVQTLDIGNTSQTPVKKLKILQTMPADATFVSVQTSDPAARASCNRKKNAELVCTVTPAANGMPQDGHLTVLITLQTHGPKQPVPCGKVLRSGDVTVSADEGNLVESVPENNVAPGVDTTVDCTDITTEISVQAMATVSPIVPAEAMGYIVTAVNNGPGKTKGMKIRHRYAEGLTFAGGSVTNCVDSPQSREVVCNPGDDTDGMQGILQPGQSAQIELHFSVDPTVQGCTYMQGSAVVSVPVTGTEALIDPVPENNQADVSTEVACQ